MATRTAWVAPKTEEEGAEWGPWGECMVGSEDCIIDLQVQGEQDVAGGPGARGDLTFPYLH